MGKRIVFVLMILFMVLPQCFPHIVVFAENKVEIPPGHYVLNKTLTVKIDMENVTDKIVWCNNTYYIIIGSRSQILILVPLYNVTVFRMRSNYMLNYTLGFNQTVLALLVVEYRLVNDSYIITPYYWINKTLYKGPELRIPLGYRLSKGFRIVNQTVVFYLYRISLSSENFSSIIIEWNIKNNNFQIINNDEMAYTAVDAPVTVVSRLERSGAVMPGTSLTIALHKDEIRSRFTARINLSYDKYVLSVTLTNIIPVKAILVDHGNRVLGLVLGQTYSFLGHTGSILYAYLMGVYRELYVKKLNALSGLAVSLNKLLVADNAGELGIYDVLTGERWRIISLPFQGIPIVLPDINGDGGQEVLFMDNGTGVLVSLASLFKWRINTGLEGLYVLGVIHSSNQCFIIGISRGILYMYNISYYGPRDNTPPVLNIYLQSNNGVSRALALRIKTSDNESGIILVVVRIRGAAIDKSFTYYLPDKHVANIDLEYGLPDGRYDIIVTSMNLLGLNTTVEEHLVIDHCPPRSSLF
ncbi:MAG: hypothetical protein GXO43_00700 [Crenarchaeota archaeon]|nr:hypothetical protein [Thermoproteota archaeon]